MRKDSSFVNDFFKKNKSAEIRIIEKPRSETSAQRKNRPVTLGHRAV